MPRPGHGRARCGTRPADRPQPGEKGELVCAQHVPVRCRSVSGRTPTAAATRPPTSTRFANGTWCPRGLCGADAAQGGLVIHGRSDAVLNPRRGADRHRGDLPPGGRSSTRCSRVHRRRPGVGRRRARGACSSSGCATALRLERGAAQAQVRDSDPRQHDAAPCTSQNHRRQRHSAHHQRQDRRVGGAQRGARQTGEEHRCPGQSTGAGAVP